MIPVLCGNRQKSNKTNHKFLFRTEFNDEDMGVEKVESEPLDYHGGILTLANFSSKGKYDKYYKYYISKNEFERT